MAGYIYILRCADGSYYTGSTTNLEYRLSEHQTGEGGSYTAARLPVKLVYSDEFPTLHDAFQFERHVKGWSRSKKEALMRRDYAALPEPSRSTTPARSARLSTGSGPSTSSG